MSGQDLGRQIAEAREQRAKIKAMAEAGDPIAALLIRRMEQAEAETLKTIKTRIFDP
jgi:hypothetical protein